MDYEKLKEELIEFGKDNLTEKRKVHTEGVRKTAIELAEKYGADKDKAEVAALAHDLYRRLKGEDLNKMVKKLGLPDIYLDNPNLAHGKIAAIMLKSKFGVTDEDILNAVSYHTTGRAGMSTLEKVVYLADCIEPGRDYPGLEEIREEEKKGLDYGCLRAMTGTIEHVKEKGGFLDSDTLEAAEYLKETI